MIIRCHMVSYDIICILPFISIYIYAYCLFRVSSCLPLPQIVSQWLLIISNSMHISPCITMHSIHFYSFLFFNYLQISSILFPSLPISSPIFTYLHPSTLLFNILHTSSYFLLHLAAPQGFSTFVLWHLMSSFGIFWHPSASFGHLRPTT